MLHRDHVPAGWFLHHAGTLRVPGHYGDMDSERVSETGRTYDVSADCEVPDLSQLSDVARVASPIWLILESTYFDTADLRLLRARVTLRRRTAAGDDGWHLTLPGTGDRREEVQLPASEANGVVPEALMSRLRVHARTQSLIPVAVLSSSRLVHRLLDEAGNVLAELCDNHVRAETHSVPTVDTWREWDLELVHAPHDLLDSAEPHLLAAGARRAVDASELSRVLAERLPVSAGGRHHDALGRKPSVTDLLSAYLGEHLRRLEEQDRQLRSGDQEDVHQLRVAARRLRSALATYAPVLSPDSPPRLRSELKWLGGELAGARDAQVMRQRLAPLARQQPPELMMGPVLERIDIELQRRTRSGRARAVEALNSDRYFHLLDLVDLFLDDLRIEDGAPPSGRKAVPALLRSDLARLRKRHRAVEAATDPELRNIRMHDVRKAAKRLRYAAETAQPVFGTRAMRLASQAEALQELLGELQDTVVARATLREISAQAHLSDEDGFAFGRLHALEEARAAQVEQDYRSVLMGLPLKDLPTWLKG